MPQHPCLDSRAASRNSLTWSAQPLSILRCPANRWPRS